MAVYNAYDVQYYNSATSSWVGFGDVVSLRCMVGRMSSTASWQISSTIVRAKYPQGFDSPLPITVGTPIRWFAPGRSFLKPSWTGVVKNVRAKWGMPWNPTTKVGNDDEVEIEMEGGLSLWGRQNFEFTGLTDEFDTIVTVLGDSAAAPIGNNIPDTTATKVEYNAGTKLMLSWLTQAVAGFQGRIVDGVANQAAWNGSPAGEPASWVGKYSDTPQAPVMFSDTANNATNRKYTEVEFDGIADEFFNRVEVNPETLATQAAATPPGNRVLDVPTYNKTTATADYLADFLLALYSNPSPSMARITATTANQHTQNLDTLGVTDLELGYLVQYRVALQLRGQTFYGQIEGVEIDASLSETVYTYHLSPATAGNWFTLNSADYGRLNEDRLGFI